MKKFKSSKRNENKLQSYIEKHLNAILLKFYNKKTGYY
jgi:hypothetical protein